MKSKDFILKHAPPTRASAAANGSGGHLHRRAAIGGAEPGKVGIPPLKLTLLQEQRNGNRTANGKAITF